MSFGFGVERIRLDEHLIVFSGVRAARFFAGAFLVAVFVAMISSYV